MGSSRPFRNVRRIGFTILAVAICGCATAGTFFADWSTEAPTSPGSTDPVPLAATTAGPASAADPRTGPPEVPWLTSQGRVSAMHRMALEAPFDRDGDGNVDPDLAKDHAAWLAEWRRAESRRVVAHLMTRLDGDRDGVLATRERAALDADWFPVAQAQRAGATVAEARLRTKLAWCDADGDGVLNHIESAVGGHIEDLTLYRRNAPWIPSDFTPDYGPDSTP